MDNATVTKLPTAAGEPVVNPRRAGRYPACVLVIPNWLRAVRVGGYAVVTQGPNRGLICEVMQVDRPRQGESEPDFLCKSLGRPFRSLRFVDSGEAAPDSIEAHVRRSWLRPVPQPAKQDSQRYELPVFPTRWERNLSGIEGGANA